MDQGVNRRIAIRIEDSEDIQVKGNGITGSFDEGISVTSTKNFYAEGNTIQLDEYDIEFLKEQLSVEIEKIITEAKAGDSSKLRHLYDFLTQISSGALLSFLESKGWFIPKP